MSPKGSSETQERQPLLANQTEDYSNPTRTVDEETGQNDDATPPHTEALRLGAIQKLPWYRRPTVYWLLPFIFMIAIAIGVNGAPQEQLIIKIICKEYLSSGGPSVSGPGSTTPVALGLASFKNHTVEDPCYSPEIQAISALVLSRYRSLKFITAIFTVGFYTTLSDTKGRKSLIYLTLIPALLTQILVMYMASPSSKLGIWILYVDALMMGSMGGGLLLEPSMNAYVADSTPRQGRSLSIGLVMVSLSIGMTVGPILGSILMKLTGGDILSAVICASVMIGLATLYALILPESHLKEFRTPKTVKSKDDKQRSESPMIRFKNGVAAALEPLLVFLPGGIETSPDVNELPSRFVLPLLLTSYGSLIFTVNGIATTLIPYTNLVYGWTAFEDQIYVAIFGATSFIVYIAIFPALQKVYKVVVNKRSTAAAKASTSHGNDSSEGREEAKRHAGAQIDIFFLIFGGVFYIASYVIVPIFESGGVMYISAALRALGSVAIASFTSLLTSFIPGHQVGRVLGGVCILDTILMTLSSLVYGWVFAKTSITAPAAIYWLSTASSVVSVIAALAVWVIYKRAEKRA
ncbi:hypothetical protein BGW38_005951 [Lunasporangiospora selenospora]|uniref:MFS general substrate transporter n=1 Tax=Lunasporangiospora selenospora TaxID=979761 RepID=A0A9P6FZC5_9FUNG|nr:hypothetical protein BGW38_005951 [Lunasporangiospora selenospora]